ncbi:hypothetical protein MLD52_04115 [Puniceicoccaceae bacterium K14]|nr:hypothetical protein [Puniceicoccaceae bacterium K14]
MSFSSHSILRSEARPQNAPDRSLCKSELSICEPLDEIIADIPKGTRATFLKQWGQTQLKLEWSPGWVDPHKFAAPSIRAKATGKLPKTSSRASKQYIKPEIVLTCHQMK